MKPGSPLNRDAAGEGHATDLIALAEDAVGEAGRAARESWRPLGSLLAWLPVSCVVLLRMLVIPQSPFSVRAPTDVANSPCSIRYAHGGRGNGRRLWVHGSRRGRCPRSDRPLRSRRLEHGSGQQPPEPL